MKNFRIFTVLLLVCYSNAGQCCPLPGELTLNINTTSSNTLGSTPEVNVDSQPKQENQSQETTTQNSVVSWVQDNVGKIVNSTVLNKVADDTKYGVKKVIDSIDPHIRNKFISDETLAAIFVDEYSELNYSLSDGLDTNIVYCRWDRPDGYTITNENSRNYITSYNQNSCSLKIFANTPANLGDWTCHVLTSGSSNEEIIVHKTLTSIGKPKAVGLLVTIGIIILLVALILSCICCICCGLVCRRRKVKETTKVVEDKEDDKKDDKKESSAQN